ncbi:hypothetical protein KM043_004923 [Ampulex compressa]|nr:hypothetical protein KM043_004923 [Ampulex compressa]
MRRNGGSGRTKIRSNRRDEERDAGLTNNSVQTRLLAERVAVARGTRRRTSSTSPDVVVVVLVVVVVVLAAVAAVVVVVVVGAAGGFRGRRQRSPAPAADWPSRRDASISVANRGRLQPPLDRPQAGLDSPDESSATAKREGRTADRNGIDDR